MLPVVFREPPVQTEELGRRVTSNFPPPLPTLFFFPPSQNPSSPPLPSPLLPEPLLPLLPPPFSSHIPQINYLLYPRVLEDLVSRQSLLHVSHQQLGDQLLCLRGNPLPLLQRQNNACTCSCPMSSWMETFTLPENSYSPFRILSNSMSCNTNKK